MENAEVDVLQSQEVAAVRGLAPDGGKVQLNIREARNELTVQARGWQLWWAGLARNRWEKFPVGRPWSSLNLGLCHFRLEAST